MEILASLVSVSHKSVESVDVHSDFSFLSQFVVSPGRWMSPR